MGFETGNREKAHFDYTLIYPTQKEEWLPHMEPMQKYLASNS